MNKPHPNLGQTDSQVDLVLKAGLRGLTYIVVMERLNVLEEDVVAIHDEGEPTEMSVEIPAAPVSESALASGWPSSRASSAAPCCCSLLVVVGPVVMLLSLIHI